MYVLSGKQPWFWAIVTGHKRIENRKWRPWERVRGKQVALHASKTWDPVGERMCCEVMDLSVLPAAARITGAIVGVATVEDTIVTTTPEAENVEPGQGFWFMGPYGWVLSNVHALETPIPCRGSLALWPLPDLLHEELREQLGDKYIPSVVEDKDKEKSDNA
jgi:hypothetical protein